MDGKAVKSKNGRARKPGTQGSPPVRFSMQGPRNRKFGASASRRTLSAQRASRLAGLCALRQLRLSVIRHRPITLPNLMRLFHRNHARLLPGQPNRSGAAFGGLDKGYRREHPFTKTNWRQWRGEI